MKSFFYIFSAYLVIISIIAVIICVFDKRRAIRQGRRIRESTLLYISVLGGSAVMYITMRLIHHKTLHKKFMLGIPAIMLLQVAAGFLIYKYLL